VHELRSPVTAIDLAAQNIEAGVVADAERLRKYGATIRVEARRLGATVERVLQFASINGGQSALSRVPVGVAALVDRVVARARLQFRGAAIHLSCAIPDTASVMGDQASLESCVENLVANAVRHVARPLTSGSTPGSRHAGAPR
jgi:signal transduction histidine kinase